jgi:hypothetical protein
VRLKFTIRAITSVEDDANNDAVIIGVNHQTYGWSFATVPGCTNFNDGDYNLSPHGVAVGYVSFSLPKSVLVGMVDFGFGPAQWQVNPLAAAG